MSQRKLPPSVAKISTAPKRKSGSGKKSSAAKKQKANTGKAAKRASKFESDSGSSDGTRTYALFSKRRNRVFTPFVPREQNTVTLKPEKPYYPRMDGGDFHDYNKGETIYLVAKETGGKEKRIAKLDLSLFNIRDDPDWDVKDEEEITWDKLRDEEDYEPTVDSLPEFLKKVAKDGAELVEDSWRVCLGIDRKQLSVFLSKVVITLPDGS